ncbi:MAG TPA: histidine kinase [Streptosporangiaceae bacterium]|nr:histidine kinase [Streptosporangiaceae bacterium]
MSGPLPAKTRPSPGHDAGPVATAWPGSVLERVAVFLIAELRRPAGPAMYVAFLAAGSVVLALRPGGMVSMWVLVPLAVVATAPLAVARRFPACSLGLVLAANACYLLFPQLRWPATAGIAGLLALGLCPNLLPRWPAVAVAIVSEVVVLCAAVLPRSVNGRPWDAAVSEALAVVAAWATGEMVRTWRQGSAERVAAQAEVRALGERSALARERASIARELHDVVAHHVSLIAVRAATAPYAIAGLPAEGQAAFHEIAAQSRTALSELRVILGVLRGPDGQPEAAPQPRITDIDGMLARIVQTGTDVVMTVRGERRELPGSVELCVYRIVQEAMTNTARYAPGAGVAVDLCYLAGGVRVRVHDSGPAPGCSATPDRGTPGGFGLAGMRERAAALGGDFEAGPDGRGGFRVSAFLPVSAEVPPAAGTPPAIRGHLPSSEWGGAGGSMAR